MKCIHCGTDSTYRERATSRSCKACRRPFAFEPKLDKRMTDMTFKLAIDGVSDRGQYLWNDDQLYYALCRRVRRRRVFHRLIRKPMPSLSRFDFDSLYARWIEAHGEPSGRLVGRQFGRDSEAVAAEVAAHGVDRLVVCDSLDAVDVLLANGFHADARCPVLAVSGYPEHVYEGLLPLLRRDPPAVVVVVHEASWQGAALARVVQDDPRWFGGVELPHVVDAGLGPADARSYRGLWQRATTAREAAAGEPPEKDAKWLSSYRLELAAARPRVLATVLARVLRGETEGRTGDDGIWIAGGPWEDADDDVG